MGISSLTVDEQRRVDLVLAWIDRMGKRYGGTVYERSGLTWDWGQALCRECYGRNWNEEIIRLGIETPTWDDIARAKGWEDGELPEWFMNKERS